MTQRQLRLVPLEHQREPETAAMATTPTRAAPPAAKTARQRVFEHWVFMFGKNPKRCALGPVRQKVIDRALALYGGDEEMAMLAIEGAASSEWHAGGNEDGRVYDDIELFLRDEAHIERFAAMGEQLRERAAAAQARESAVPLAAVPDAAAAHAAREKVRQMAAASSRRRLG